MDSQGVESVEKAPTDRQRQIEILAILIDSTHSDHGDDKENELQNEVENRQNPFRRVLIPL